MNPICTIHYTYISTGKFSVVSICEILVVVFKVDGCSRTDILQEDLHKAPHDLGSKTWSEWKQREEFMEEVIGGLNVWNENVCRVICKELDMREESLQACDILIYVLCDCVFEIGHDIIFHYLLQLEEYGSYGVRYLLGANGWRTAHKI